MSATTSTTKELFTCPACGITVTGRLAIEFELTGEVIDKQAEARVKVTGLRVEHDCTPKIARDIYRSTFNEDQAAYYDEQAHRAAEPRPTDQIEEGER